jgi:hypothetical protein
MGENGEITTMSVSSQICYTGILWEEDMFKTEKCLHFAVLLLIGILCIGCQGTADSNDLPSVTPTQASALGEHTINPHIRGTIISISVPEGRVHGFVVHGVIEPDTEYDKAFIGVTEITRVYLQTDSGYELVDPNRLTVDMKVEVLFIGTILESYPIQAEAGEILIIP